LADAHTGHAYFERAVKRLHRQQKTALDEAVRAIVQQPEIGETKVGDLAGVQVYKFRLGPAPCLLAYRVLDDNTLKLDIDTGMQTRLFHFNQREAQGVRSWQGWSNSSWQFSGTTEQFYPGPTSLGQIKRAGVLRVDTNNLKAGYLRKNGVPFSENAFMTEYYNLVVEDDGNQYLVVQLFVADPRYLTGHWVRTVQFRRERDASKRNPTPCSAS